MEKERLRAVGYRRVSMREQVDGHSLNAQAENIRNYSAGQAWDLLEIYRAGGGCIPFRGPGGEKKDPRVSVSLEMSSGLFSLEENGFLIDYVNGNIISQIGRKAL